MTKNSQRDISEVSQSFFQSCKVLILQICITDLTIINSQKVKDNRST